MKKLSIGIIGMGSRAYSLIRPLLSEQFAQRVEITAVYDPDELKREFARETVKSDTLKLFDNREEFLKSGLDLVMVCTPQSGHAENAIAALESGIDLFLEKPMARTAAECQSIIDAEKKSGKRVFMGFNLRHHPVCSQIADMVNSEKIGHVQQIICTDFYNGGYSYFRRWHRLTKNSGGLAVEKGCHSIDQINRFARSVPVCVSAFGGLDRFLPDREGADYCSNCGKKESCAYYMDMDKAEETTKNATGIDAVIVNGGQKLDMCVFNSDKDTFDNHIIMIEYANGCRAVLAECFTSSVKATSGRQFVLNGWDGQIWAEMSNRRIRFYPNAPSQGKMEPEETTIPPAPGNHGGADNLMLEYVIDCLETGKENTQMLTTDGYYSVAVAEAAEIAVLEKRIVEIAPPQL